MSDPILPPPPPPPLALPATPATRAPEAGKLTSFTYSGPPCSTAIGEREVNFFPGRDFDLPADDEHVTNLVELGFLKQAQSAVADDKATKYKKGGK